jgi:hypothetical protein
MEFDGALYPPPARASTASDWTGTCAAIMRSMMRTPKIRKGRVNNGLNNLADIRETT